MLLRKAGPEGLCRLLLEKKRKKEMMAKFQAKELQAAGKLSKGLGARELDSK